MMYVPQRAGGVRRYGRGLRSSKGQAERYTNDRGGLGEGGGLGGRRRRPGAFTDGIECSMEDEGRESWATDQVYEETDVRELAVQGIAYEPKADTSGTLCTSGGFQTRGSS